mmetsp:Transcript_5159/g.14437  ORF Transcript_5159/g.14437 Transcript_5159/m.14437 type:complete len:92 (+) Transcript_5159:132-407(+)
MGRGQDAGSKGVHPSVTPAAERRKTLGKHEKHKVDKQCKPQRTHLTKSESRKERPLRDQPFTLRDRAESGVLLLLVAGMLVYWTSWVVQQF